MIPALVTITVFLIAMVAYFSLISIFCRMIFGDPKRKKRGG